MLLDDIYAISDIDASVSALRMFSISIAIDRPLKEVFDLFKDESDLPGVILTHHGQYVDVLLRVRFFELMSQTFMMEIFKNKPIEFFQSEYPTLNKLQLPEYTLIVKAVELILRREKEFRDDPVIVECSDGSIKLIDVYRLLLAHNHIHMLTMQQLKNANDFKDEMLHIIAHDLKNPINGINGYVLMIEENVVMEAEPRQWLGKIQNSCSKMLDLIGDLLQSAVRDNQLILQISNFNISELLREVISSLEKSAHLKGQHITFRSESSSDCLIAADRLKLYEAFENLISNAIKYSPLKASVEVSIIIQQGQCRICVSDRGQGFSSSDRKHLFKKFQRLSARPTAGESSTGLGLYIVKNIIKLHSGNITVEDREGGGSSFIVTLPGMQCAP